MTCMLLFLCLTSAQTRPGFCSLAVGEGDVVSSCPRGRSWPGLGRGPWAVKAQAILDQHVVGREALLHHCHP